MLETSFPIFKEVLCIFPRTPREREKKKSCYFLKPQKEQGLPMRSQSLWVMMRQNGRLVHGRETQLKGETRWEHGQSNTGWTWEL